jgi:hypothetical protein
MAATLPDPLAPAVSRWHTYGVSAPQALASCLKTANVTSADLLAARTAPYAIGILSTRCRVSLFRCLRLFVPASDAGLGTTKRGSSASWPVTGR